MKLLSDLLEKGAILCPLDEVEKWAAIEMCVRSLPQVASKVVSYDDAMTAIRQREAQEQSTMLGNGVAIPHGILPDPAPLVGALGVSHTGVAYDVGGKKATLLFIILGSHSVRKDYLGVLAQIARLFRSKDLRGKVIQAKTPEEALAIIREAEK